MKKVLLVLVSFLLTTSVFAEEPKAIAERITKDSIALAKKEGKDAAISAINKGKFKQGDIYVTAYDLTGKCLAHATKAARVGNNNMNEKDVDGVLFIKERIEIAKTKGTGWHSYKYQNPDSKKVEPKNNYVELFDGVVYSAGYYIK